ncbi:17943_t:CDS:1, partial [Cetraspora pellucida]
NKPKRNCMLVEELFFKNIHDEKNISDTIEIQNIDCADAMNYFEDTREMQDQENLNQESKKFLLII